MDQRLAPRPDRKTVEKNRRMQMKALYSKAYSLLPTPCIKKEGRASPLPERLDLVVNYIKELQERLENMKERKKQLLNDSALHTKTEDLGVGLQVIMTSSKDDWSTFRKVIRILEEDGTEIGTANFSVVGHPDKCPNK